jgi:hypothetical protein
LRLVVPHRGGIENASSGDERDDGARNKSGELRVAVPAIG